LTMLSVAEEAHVAMREQLPVKQLRTIHDALPRGRAALRGNQDLNPPHWMSPPGAKNDLQAGWYFEKSKGSRRGRERSGSAALPGSPDVGPAGYSQTMPGRERSSSSSSRIWERLWDPKLFTGSHKHRFDVETGRGLGRSGRSGGTVTTNRQKFRSDPRMLVCYLCGTMHGVCSLIHHHGPCALRRHRSNMPDASNPPTVPIPGENCSRGDCDVYNEAAQAAYESGQPYCRVCTRTFATVEKLRKHEKCCIQILDKSFFKPKGMTGRNSPVRPTSPQRGRGYGPGYLRQGKEFVNGHSL